MFTIGKAEEEKEPLIRYKNKTQIPDISTQDPNVMRIFFSQPNVAPAFFGTNLFMRSRSDVSVVMCQS